MEALFQDPEQALFPGFLGCRLPYRSTLFIPGLLLGLVDTLNPKPQTLVNPKP